jgi:2-C-methyl-D-erythritol 2,4-cyclodiphosphate synthase
MTVGIGYDCHRLVKNRKFILGGIELSYELGLLGHSDADALCHAVIDALLGASGLGDIGTHFPDSDMKWKDASSIDMLKQVVEMVHEKGFDIQWLDTVIITEKPKIAPYILKIKEKLSQTGINYECINIKAKTREGMGFVGRGEGVEVHAVCLLNMR